MPLLTPIANNVDVVDDEDDDGDDHCSLSLSLYWSMLARLNSNKLIDPLTHSLSLSLSLLKVGFILSLCSSMFTFQLWSEKCLRAVTKMADH